MQKSSRKLATRKLNMIVDMVGHCSALTSEDNLKRDTKYMQLAENYEYIIERQKQFKSLKQNKLKYAIMDALPSEITKLKTNNCDFAKITKIELAAIMWSVFKYFTIPPILTSQNLYRR